MPYFTKKALKDFLARAHGDAQAPLRQDLPQSSNGVASPDAERPEPAKPLDLAPIKARQHADAKAFLDRGFHTDPEATAMRLDRAALIREVERLRGIWRPVPMTWPA